MPMIAPSPVMAHEATKSSAARFVMATQQPRANIEAARMIEGMLYELVPTLDKTEANRTARRLARLRPLRSLDSNTGSERLKFQLKKLSKKLLDMAEQRRHASSDTSCSSHVNEVSSKVRRPSMLDENNAKRNCHRFLIDTVGESMYREILSVSRDIEYIRKQSAVWTKFSPRYSPFHYGREEEERAPVSEALPAPIADLYFRTRLVDAMRLADTRGVGRTHWEALLRDARTKLAAFRRFEAENVNEDEDLSFCCGGVCSRRAHH